MILISWLRTVLLCSRTSSKEKSIIITSVLLRSALISRFSSKGGRTVRLAARVGIDFCGGFTRYAFLFLWWPLGGVLSGFSLGEASGKRETQTLRCVLKVARNSCQRFLNKYYYAKTSHSLFIKRKHECSNANMDLPFAKAFSLGQRVRAL